jgi:hypothetical protein
MKLEEGPTLAKRIKQGAVSLEKLPACRGRSHHSSKRRLASSIVA